MHVAHYPPVSRNSAFRRTIRQARERPCAIRPVGHAHVHLVAGERNTIIGCTGHSLKTLVTGEHRFNVDQSETIDPARRTFNTIGVGNRASEHLITAA